MTLKWFCCPSTCSLHHWSSLRQLTNKKNYHFHKMPQAWDWLNIRGLRSWMPFDFSGKIWEISCPEHLGISSSSYRLSPTIGYWPFPVPSKSRKWNRNSRIWNFVFQFPKFLKFNIVRKKWTLHIYVTDESCDFDIEDCLALNCSLK